LKPKKLKLKKYVNVKTNADIEAVIL